MARREASGEVRFSGGIWTTRIRFYTRIPLDLPTCTSEIEALARSRLLAQFGKRFRLASVNEARGRESLTLVAAASDKAMPNALIVAEDLLGSRIPAKDRPKTLTFSEVAKKWTGGELHRDYPDQVKRKDHDLDKTRLEKLCAIVVNGTDLGSVPIDRFTLDHAEGAMRSLDGMTEKRKPKRAATRRGYAQLIHRVLALAVYPLRLIPASPLPKGFMPKIGKPPAHAYLYPTEDAKLLGCTTTDDREGLPLGYRVLYGFLAREGCRLGEAVALRWRDVDLVRGVITLDKNKTDDARAWAMDPGVTRALQAWREQNDHDFVFVHDGGVFDPDGLAERLRADLLAAGVDRAELHTAGENRGKFRVHDLRGTFVTLSLAAGRSETWVADRTGHTSSQMINRYRRAARSAGELSLGQLAPLDQVIPELRKLPQECPTDPTMADDGGQAADESSMIPAVPVIPAAPQNAEHVFNPPVASSNLARPTDPGAILGQSERAGSDPYEAALLRALDAASGKGDTKAISDVCRLLDAHRLARAGVVALDSRRARRER
jgi:integrase